FLHYVQKDAVPAREFLEKSFPLLKAAEIAEPDNPRVLWVLGASQWYTPSARGGGQQLAIQTYEKGLKSARMKRSAVKDPLYPSWGEPELLMNLAFANLNASTPDLKAAEGYAEDALKIVPYWHYVRDIQLPQIRATIRK